MTAFLSPVFSMWHLERVPFQVCGNTTILIQYVCSGALEFEFLMSSQEMQVLLVQGP